MSAPSPPPLSASCAKQPDLDQEGLEEEQTRFLIPDSQIESTGIFIDERISNIEDRMTTAPSLTLRFRHTEIETSILLDEMAMTRSPTRSNRVGKAPRQSLREEREGKRTLLKKVADETMKKIPSILQGNFARGPPFGYKVGDKTAPPLDPTNYFPNFKNTQVKVVNSDTLDAALALHNARDILESQDGKEILVLSFANAYRPGGGWKNGAMAQEEAICYRSTLSATLPRRFYPLSKRECIYSPCVTVFRENVERGHSFMWADKPDLLPMVAVVTMAATNKPAVDKSVTPFRYKHDSERMLTEDNMRMILRVAGDNYHRRLVLGAIGCGVFGHPSQQVAECWKKVLQEEEFKGWFETILFAVLDRSDNSHTFRAFKDTLHNLKI